MSSSTSNSEQPFDVGRTPWALLIALLIILGVELWVRAQEPSSLIPYENTGRNAYRAVVEYIDSYGAADIAVIGSSRGREGVAIPTILEQLADTEFNDRTVANYASPAATVDENELFVRFMMDEDHKPDIIIYPATMLQLAVNSHENTHSVELWGVREWKERRRLNKRQPLIGGIPNKGWNEFPDALRMELNHVWKTFAYRDHFSVAALEASSRRDAPARPMEGDYSLQQRDKSDVSLLTRKVREKKVLDYLSKRMKGKRYPLGGPTLRHLNMMARLCEEHSIPLVIIELPVSSYLREYLPPETLPEFRHLMNECEGRFPDTVTFVQLEQLGETFNADDFRDISHLNLQGAERYSAAITKRIILPMLRNTSPDLLPKQNDSSTAYDDTNYPGVMNKKADRQKNKQTNEDPAAEEPPNNDDE